MSGQPSPSRSAADGRHRIAAGDLRDARCVGHVGEGAVAAIAIEQVGVRRQSLRAAVDRHAFPEAVRAGAGLGRGGEIEAQVVGDEQVEPAVPVVVDERAAGAPTRPGRGEPGRRGHVLESPDAVAIQHVLPVGGDEQIGPAVVVEVARADARRPRRCAAVRRRRSRPRSDRRADCDRAGWSDA